MGGRVIVIVFVNVDARGSGSGIVGSGNGMIGNAIASVSNRYERIRVRVCIGR